MSGPVSRRELIRRLRALGFSGPVSGGKHAFLVRGALKLHIPNPHQQDVSEGLLRRILRQAGVALKDWENAS